MRYKGFGKHLAAPIKQAKKDLAVHKKGIEESSDKKATAEGYLEETSQYQLDFVAIEKANRVEMEKAKNPFKKAEAAVFKPGKEGGARSSAKIKIQMSTKPRMTFRQPATSWRR